MSKRFTQGALLCSILIMSLFLNTNLSAATITDFIVPRGFTFNKNLIKGTTISPDVYYLQNILNISTSTRVSEKDSGANGKLTSYFGDKTESALGRFQQTFYKDIEYEKAISTTTGSNQYVISPMVVDQYTRIVLNKLVVIYNDQLDTYKRVRLATSTLPFSSTTKFKTDEGKTEEKFDVKKGGFQYSPQGLLLKLLGGEDLVNKIYGYTPVGMIEGGGAGGGGGGAAAGGGLAALGGIGGAGGGGVAAASGIFNFGGFVTSTMLCGCSFNILLYVKDPRGSVIPLMYQPGATVLYKMYTPTVGVNVLGKYVSGGQCQVYVVSGCASGGSPLGTMIQLGTSAL